MSELKRFEVNNNEYVAHCESVSTRSGFAHIVKLYKNNDLVTSNKVNYYNRTWESYRYQTAILGCFRALKEELVKKLKSEFMDAHSYGRMTAKRMEEFESYIADNMLLNEYNKALETL